MTATAVAHPPPDRPPRETVYRCASPKCGAEWCRIPRSGTGSKAVRKFCDDACMQRDANRRHRLRVLGSIPSAEERGKALTENEHDMRRQLRADVVIDYPKDIERPRTRADCIDGPRPCPFVSCRHHLYLEVEPSGSLKINNPTLEVWQMPETCSLDIAAAGGATLEVVGIHINLTRERVRQVEVKGMTNAARLARNARLKDVLP